jgi:hypothetical protein
MALNRGKHNQEWSNRTIMRYQSNDLKVINEKVPETARGQKAMGNENSCKPDICHCVTNWVANHVGGAFRDASLYCQHFINFERSEIN